MAITIRLGKEEEHALFLDTAQHGTDLADRMEILAGAMQRAFPGLTSGVRLEGADGTLLAQNEPGTHADSRHDLPCELRDQLAEIEAEPREAGAAFAALAGLGNPDPALREMPFRSQAAAAAERAAAAREARLPRRPAGGAGR